MHTISRHDNKHESFSLNTKVTYNCIRLEKKEIVMIYFFISLQCVYFSRKSFVRLYEEYKRLHSILKG